MGSMIGWPDCRLAVLKRWAKIYNKIKEEMNTFHCDPDRRTTMKSNGFLLKGMVALLGLLMLGLAQSNPVMAARYKIYPEADSYVDSQHPDSNYGTDTYLYAVYAVEYLGSPLTQRSFLKFDLSGIPVGFSITAAKLYLYVTSNGGHPPLNTDLYHVGNGWTESGITWNNQPAPDAYLATHDYMDWGHYYAWNLFESELWNPSQDLANRQISLMIKLRDEGAPPEDFIGFTFYSRSGTKKPYLEVTTGADPAASMLLLSTD
jgi:hypothetical protein